LKRTVKAASVVLAVIIAVTIVIVLYDSGTFTSTVQLQTDGFLSIAPEEQAADFYRSKTEVIDVSLGMMAVNPLSSFAEMDVYVSNHTGILDSLYLTFVGPSLAQPIQCYLQTPNGVSATVKLGADLSTIVEVNGYAMQTGSFFLQFLVWPGQANSFLFEVNFTMRPTGFPPTRQAGYAQAELPFRFVNAT
jgi:hypothetical protein